MENNQMMTRKEVANYFNVKPQTVKQWQRFGKIKPYCRINGRPRYRLEDLQHLMISDYEIAITQKPAVYNMTLEKLKQIIDNAVETAMKSN